MHIAQYMMEGKEYDVILFSVSFSKNHVEFMIGPSRTCVCGCAILTLANSRFPWASKALPVSPRVCFLCTRQFPFSINTGQTVFFDEQPFHSVCEQERYTDYNVIHAVNISRFRESKLMFLEPYQSPRV